MRSSCLRGFEVAHTRETLSNWLALLALLAIGIVWPAANAATTAEAHAGSLLLRAAAQQGALEALRQSTRLRAVVTMQIGERTVRGEIRRREEAHAAYAQARSEGRQASLIDQERPNMFSAALANIAPAAEVTVRIAYLDPLPYRDGRYQLSLPLVTCYPFDALLPGGPLRWVVTADAIGDG
jgi:Vault protein inter-alpha-trypsin domain